MNQLRTHKKRNRIASLIIGASLPFVSFTSACTGIVPPNFSDSLGLVPQFNLITLPGQQDWNHTTLKMMPDYTGQYVECLSNVEWNLTLNKDFYTVAISVVNSDEFLQKYGENNYVTLSDAVYTGMLHKDFKLGYGAYNENGAPMIPDMTIAGTFINGTGDRSDPVIWNVTNNAVGTCDNDSSFVYAISGNTFQFNPFVMPNDFTVKMILTLFDENDNKASVYDAFEIALIPDGMDDLFSLKVKSGYYFKYTAEYDFPYLDFSQTFDEWGYDSQDVTVKESLALDPITQNFNDALTTVLASVPWSVPNSPNPIRPIYDTSFSSEWDGLYYGILLHDDLSEQGKQQIGWLDGLYHLGQETQQDGYTIESIRLADIIRGLKSDGSFTEIETSEALLTHYDIDFSFTQNPLGETIISVLPWVDQDQDRNQWLHVPKFTNSWTYNPFHDLPDYTGFLAQLDIKEKNDGGLLYSYSFPLFGTSPQSIWYWY